MRGNEEKDAEHANDEKTTLTTDGECLASYIYMISQKFIAFSGLNPTNTSQLNQHARVQRKYCKLMKKQTNECWDYTNCPSVILNKCELSLN